MQGRELVYKLKTKQGIILYLKLGNEFISSQVIQQIVHSGFINSEGIVIVEAIHFDFFQVQFITSKHSSWVDIWWQFFCCNKEIEMY